MNREEVINLQTGYLVDGDQPVIADAPTEITYDEDFQFKVHCNFQPLC